MVDSAALEPMPTTASTSGISLNDLLLAGPAAAITRTLRSGFFLRQQAIRIFSIKLVLADLDEAGDDEHKSARRVSHGGVAVLDEGALIIVGVDLVLAAEGDNV